MYVLRGRVAEVVGGLEQLFLNAEVLVWLDARNKMQESDVAQSPRLVNKLGKQRRGGGNEMRDKGVPRIR